MEIIDHQEENEELREMVGTNAGRIESLENAHSIDGMLAEIEIAGRRIEMGNKQGWHAWQPPHQLDLQGPRGQKYGTFPQKQARRELK